jgi:hypothetical protein
MLANFTRAPVERPHAEKPRRWLRDGTSVLVLLASVSALGVMVWERHANRFQTETLAGLVPSFLMSAVHTDHAEPQNPPDATPRADPNEGRYRALAEFLARRYRVSEDATFDLVSFSHAAGQQLGLDPLLIIAVIAVESRFNPIAESVAGAKGLMQVIPKYHPEKLKEFGGEQAVFDPQTNIFVGSKILKEYLSRTGSITSALQLYAGAANDLQDVYSSKVMNEKQRLQQVVNQSKRQSVRVAQTAAAQDSRGN